MDLITEISKFISKLSTIGNNSESLLVIDEDSKVEVDEASIIEESL